MTEDIVGQWTDDEKSHSEYSCTDFHDEKVDCDDLWKTL